METIGPTPTAATGDFVFHSDYDHISNLTHARQAGWCESLDTGDVLVELLPDPRVQRIEPTSAAHRPLMPSPVPPPAFVGVRIPVTR